MADVIIRRVTVVRHEYALPSPTTAQELDKAIRGIQKSLPDDCRDAGDAYHVEARDDEIVLWWEEESR